MKDVELGKKKLKKAEWPRVAVFVDEVMKNIEYGWMDRDGLKHWKVDGNFAKKYRLQAPEGVLKSKAGVCWDQVELERFLMPSDVKVRTIFLVYYGEKQAPTHTALLFEEDRKTYWYEHAWEKYKGVYEYSDFKEAVKDIRKKWINFEAEKDMGDGWDLNRLFVYEYERMKPHISTRKFYKHCEAGKRLKIN